MASELEPLAKAKELALAMMEEYGIKKGYLTFTRRLPAARLEKWRQLGISLEGHGLGSHGNAAPHPHGGGQRRGQPLWFRPCRVALSDGWGGSMIATEISDVLFGTPKPMASQVNLAC